MYSNLFRLAFQAVFEGGTIDSRVAGGFLSEKALSWDHRKMRMLFLWADLWRLLFELRNFEVILSLSNLGSLNSVKMQSNFYMIIKFFISNIFAFRRGQIAGKMDDETLRQLLDRFSEHTRQTTTVKVTFWSQFLHYFMAKKFQEYLRSWIFVNI